MRNIYIGGIAGAAGFSAGDSGNKTGWAKYYGDFDACVNNADITVTYGGGTGGSFKVGGIIGSSECALIDCLNNGDVTFANNDSVTSSSPAFGGIAGVLCGTANPNASGCENHGALSLSGQFGNGGAAWAYTEGNGGTYYSVAGGCFGCVGDSSSAISDCDNYGAINFTVKGPSGNSSRVYMGGVAGRCVASISGCDNFYTTSAQTMSVNGICFAYFGGVAAVVSGGSTLTNCVNNASINMSHAMQKDPGENNPETIGGGVVGSNTSVTTVSNLENSGNISLTWSGSNNDNTYCGGVLATTSTATTLSHLENTGDISLTWTGTRNENIFYGGVIGSIPASSPNVSYCSNSGVVTYSGSADVQATAKVGGIVPRIKSSATIEHCTNSGAVNATNSMYTAGIFAYNYYATTISSCINEGAVSSTDGQYTAGVLSYGDNTVTISNSSNSGDILSTGGQYTAGVLSYGGSTVTINSCSNSGGITYDGQGQTTKNIWLAGILCYAKSTMTCSGCTNEGDIYGHDWSIDTGSYVGGILGGGYAAKNCSITDCTNNADLTVNCGGRIHLGGIAGCLYGGTASGIAHSGDIDVTSSNVSKVGGLIGFFYAGNMTASATPRNNSVTGSLTTNSGANSYTGGFVGVNNANSTYSNITINMAITVTAGNGGALIGGIVDVNGADKARTATLSSNTYAGTTLNGAAIAAGNICGYPGTGTVSGFVAP